MNKEHYTMKVSEVIHYLKRLPQDYDIYMSSDSEGNSFSTINIDKPLNLLISDLDKAIIIYPYFEGLTDYDTTPKDMNALYGREQDNE